MEFFFILKQNSRYSVIPNLFFHVSPIIVSRQISVFLAAFQEVYCQRASKSSAQQLWLTCKITE